MQQNSSKKNQMIVLMEKTVNQMLRHKKLELKNLEGKEGVKRNIKLQKQNNRKKQKETLMFSDLFQYMNRQFLETNKLFQNACEQLEIPQEQILEQTFEAFFKQNQNRYNMDDEGISILQLAWQMLWEAQEEKKQLLIQQIEQFIQKEYERMENEKKSSYKDILDYLMKGQCIQNEKHKLEKLKAGQLKDLRFYVEQQLSALKGVKKFYPRYKEVQINQENQDNIDNKLNEQKQPSPTSRKIIKWDAKLEKLKEINPNTLIMGLDKLAPKVITENQYDVNVENYDPEIMLQEELDNIRFEEEQIEQQKILKKNNFNRQLEVQFRNKEIQQNKRTELLEKQDREDKQIQERQKQQKKKQYEKQISNYMRQQDKLENFKRVQLIHEVYIQKIQDNLNMKSEKIKKFKQVKEHEYKRKGQVNKIIDNYDYQLKEYVDLFELGQIDMDQVDYAMNYIPLDLNENPQQKQQKQKNPQQSEKQRKSTRLEKQIIDLEHKHNMEMRILIEREQLAEINRQRKLKEGVENKVKELFEKQRIVAQERLQQTLNKQVEETKTLLRLYKVK